MPCEHAIYMYISLLAKAKRKATQKLSLEKYMYNVTIFAGGGSEAHANQTAIPKPQHTYDTLKAKQDRILALIFVSRMESFMSGSDSLDVIQEWFNTCAALYLWLGSMLSMRNTRSLAPFDMESQLPPERFTFPSPMRVRIFSALSSGPVANGVELKVEKREGEGERGGVGRERGRGEEKEGGREGERKGV